MWGRNGADKLAYFLMWLYVALVAVYGILSFLVPNPLFDVLYFISSVTLAVLIFHRIFSRKLDKRRRENQRFCDFWKLRKNKFRDRKTHVYRKCPSCSAVLRLPRSKGEHSVVCPRCKERFNTRV